MRKSPIPRWPKSEISGSSNKFFVICPSGSYVLLKVLFPLTIGLMIVVVAIWLQQSYWALLSVLPLGYVMYKAAYLMLLRYEVSQGQIRYYSGVFNRRADFLEIYRIKDFEISQPFVLRLLGIMHFSMTTSDKSHPVFRMEGIPKSNIADTIRELVEQARLDKRVYEVD